MVMPSRAKVVTSHIGTLMAWSINTGSLRSMLRRMIRGRRYMTILWMFVGDEVRLGVVVKGDDRSGMVPSIDHRGIYSWSARTDRPGRSLHRSKTTAPYMLSNAGTYYGDKQQPGVFVMLS